MLSIDVIWVCSCACVCSCVDCKSLCWCDWWVGSCECCCCGLPGIPTFPQCLYCALEGLVEALVPGDILFLVALLFDDRSSDVQGIPTVSKLHHFREGPAFDQHVECVWWGSCILPILQEVPDHILH